MTAIEAVRASAREIEARVAAIAAAISADHPDGVVLVGVLKGSVCFLADLARAMRVPCSIDLLALSAYSPGEHRVRILKDLDGDIAGEAVVVVADVIDTGFSLSYIVGLLEQRRAASVRLCALIARPERRIVPLEVDYVGFSCGEEFLIGYGLDFAERYRNLDALYVVDPNALVNDRDAAEAALYGGYRDEEARG